MVLADEIALEILSNQYFLKLFKVCMERSIYYTLNIDNQDSYSQKEFKDLLRFADLLSVFLNIRSEELCVQNNNIPKSIFQTKSVLPHCI